MDRDPFSRLSLTASFIGFSRILCARCFARLRLVRTNRDLIAALISKLLIFYIFRLITTEPICQSNFMASTLNGILMSRRRGDDIFFKMFEVLHISVHCLCSKCLNPHQND